MSQKTTSYQPVSDYYAGKSVFLTGATGFIGRLLIERLLYNCSDIEKVYILIRAKKNASAQQRLEELLRNPIFTKLKEVRPQDLNKIVPVAGDVADDELGINTEDEKALIEKVSVIFHSAANVKFRVPLAELLHVNYEGTKKVMELGKKMKCLDAFVHVSTAFHNYLAVIEEIPLQPPRDIQDVNRVIANHRDDSKEIRKLLDKWGNKYVFTKNMAEAYVASNHGDMRTIIVRPAMITSIYKEPLVGYTDSWVTGTVLLSDVASGLAHVVYGNKNNVVDLIPVDYVCNFLIIAAAKSSRTKKCSVYNISTGNSNPIDWRTLSDSFIKESKKHDYAVMPFPSVYFTKVSWLVTLLTFLTQVLPAFVADIWLRLTGREPRYRKLQKAATSRTALSQPVTDASWEIGTTRARELLTALDNRDREIFPCDPVTVRWDEYVPIYCRGVKEYMLGERNK